MVDSPIATSRKKLKDVMLNPDSKPTVISPEYIDECTDNFADDRFLGGGAFGAVYEGVDVITQDHFAVKRVPLTITDQETLDIIQTSFKREITVCFNSVATVSLTLVH
jgi:serine/threonine protein kinase